MYKTNLLADFLSSTYFFIKHKHLKIFVQKKNNQQTKQTKRAQDKIFYEFFLFESLGTQQSSL